MRLLVWFAIAMIVVMWLMRGKKNSIEGESPRRGTDARTGAEAMLRCLHCGVHVPASDSVTDASGAVFCCDEHGRSMSVPSFPCSSLPCFPPPSASSAAEERC